MFTKFLMPCVGVVCGFALAFALSPAQAVPAADAPKGYTLNSTAGASGLWVQRDYRDSPFAGVYSLSSGGEQLAVVGLSRNQKGDAHDFAVVATKTETYFQVRDKAGKFHFVPVEALVKLADKEQPAKQPLR